MDCRDGLKRPTGAARHFHPAQRSLAAEAVSSIVESVIIAVGFATEDQQKTAAIAMTCVTMNETSERKDTGYSAKFVNAPARLLGLGYSIAAAALRLKNRPALRLMTAIIAVVVFAITFVSSGHINRASFALSSLFLALNIFQILLILWELRPVALQGETRMLHDFVFPNLTGSAFNSLMRFA